MCEAPLILVADDRIESVELCRSEPVSVFSLVSLSDGEPGPQAVQAEARMG